MSKTQPLDCEAARADLRGKLTANEAAQAKVRDKLGALALDVTLNLASQADLDAATSEDARLTSTGLALEQALAEVDRREAAQAEADAAERRKADEGELARLLAVARKAGAQAAELVDKLASAAAEAVEAEGKAVAIARRLNTQPRRAMVGGDIALLLGSRLHESLPGIAYQRQDRGEEAGQRLRSVS